MQQQIDWPGLKVAAVALNSVRNAAMRAAVDLPPDEQRRFVERVNKRAYRERWLDLAAVRECPRDNRSERHTVQNVQNGHGVLAKAVSDNCNRARTLLSAAAVKGAKAFSQLDGRELTEKGKSTAFRNVTAATSDIGGWKDDKADRSQNVMINLQLLNG